MTITMEKRNSIHFDRETGGRALGSLKEKDSHGLFAVKIKRMSNSLKKSFTGCVVLCQEDSTHVTESATTF